MITPRFESIQHFAKYIAENIIEKVLFKNGKMIKQWDYQLPKQVIEAIPEPELKQQVESDTMEFELMVSNYLFDKIDYLNAEGFLSYDEEYIYVRSEQEIQQEIDEILS